MSAVPPPENASPRESRTLLLAGLLLFLAATAVALTGNFSGDSPGARAFSARAQSLAHTLGALAHSPRQDGGSTAVGPFTDLAQRTAEAVYGAVLPNAHSSL